MIINTRNTYPDTHIWNYNNFRITQYHLEIEGLYKLNNRYYILCPNITKDATSVDGQNLFEWFRQHSIIGTGTTLVNTLPSNAIKLEDNSKIDESNFAGAPRNFTFFYDDLLSFLPKDFPEFKIGDNNTGITFFYTKVVLDPNQEQSLEETIHKLKMSILLETKVIDNLEDVEQHIITDDFRLLRHSKSFGFNSAGIKKIWEEDEDFWIEKRSNILNHSTIKDDFYQEGFSTKQSSCLVTDYIHPQNLRNFITLYNTTYLNLPSLENYDNYLKQLEVTESDLFHLANLGKVRFILPKPLYVYHPRMIELISELPSNSYLLSRRLASITILDLRKRNPLLFPTFDNETKYKLLYELNKKKETGTLPSEFSANFLGHLSEIWGNYFEDVHRAGANALTTYSSYHFLDGFFSSHKKDLGLELLDSIPSVNYGAALQANVIPKYWGGYNDEKLVTMIANLYSGLPKGFVPHNLPFSNISVDKILVINKDVPIIDLAKTFSNGDIDKFRTLIFNLTEHKKDEVELEKSLKIFNEHVKNYESSSKRRNNIDLEGFLIDGSLAINNVNIPLATWVIDRTTKMLSDVGIKSGTIQALIDNIEAVRTGVVLPEAVLVARMRNQLKESWFKGKLR
jgi:hypothetical protein